MTDSLLVHEFHSHEYLSHEVFDVAHRNKLAILLRVLNDFLEILRAELKDEVLHHFALLVLRVVNVEQLHDVLAASQPVKHFELARDVLSTLACSLNRN